jgi:hypothetical protein
MLLLLFCDPSVAIAESGGSSHRESNAESWLPAVGFLLAVDSQEGVGSASSSARISIEEDGTILTPLVGLEAELMTPSLFSSLGSPRLFVRGGATRAFDVERTIVQEGSVGEITIPVIDPDGDGNPDQRTPIAAVGGQGTLLRTQVQPWGFMAAAGLAFELPFLGDGARMVRIKPSIEYRREQLRVTAFLGGAESIDLSELCPCRSVNLEATSKRTLHAIGPGLEVEMDTGHIRSSSVTIYGAFRAYRVIDGRSINVDRVGEFDDGTPVSLGGRFRRDRWSYRFGVGLRLRWNPS